MNFRWAVAYLWAATCVLSSCLPGDKRGRFSREQLVDGLSVRTAELTSSHLYNQHTEFVSESFLSIFLGKDLDAEEQGSVMLFGVCSHFAVGVSGPSHRNSTKIPMSLLSVMYFPRPRLCCSVTSASNALPAP